MNFNNFEIGNEILTALKKLGYEKPSTVQEQVIPKALEGKDLVVKSKTGTGKTAAFGIPICERVDIEERKPQALILTPTRELCVQVKDEITNIGRLKRIKCTAIFGKQPYEAQVNALKQRTHIVSGTPGRTLDHIERGTLDLSEIKYLVIDEADEMLKLGFIDQVEAIISKVRAEKITMLFSATIPEEFSSICNKYMKKPETIEIDSEITADNLQHLYYEVEENDKFDLLIDILYSKAVKSGIIFCSTKERSGTLASRMRKRQIPCEALHGGMLQNERLSIMNRFKKGEFMFLVTTDVAARGIDVDSIPCIINYDIPMEKDRYVHRTGRTARAGKSGYALTFVSSNQRRFQEQVEEYIGFKLEKAERPSFDEIQANKDSFIKEAKRQPEIKAPKTAKLNQDIMKIYIGAGKKKKIRPGDIVGAITGIPEVSPEDIGIIEILDNHSYVEILNRKGHIVLDGLKHKTIKGKTVKVQKSYE